MSTRCSIKSEWDPATQRGFHVYEDLMDGMLGHPRDIYLELTGVEFEANVGEWPGGRVEITIPREWAISLGLIKPDEPAEA